MIILCAVDQEWNIGCDGQLLCKISADLKRFKELTTGNIMIMGRKTFDSLPGGKALPNRTNIVFTKNKDYTQENTLVVRSTKELLTLLKEINPNNKQTNYVTGGGEIVRELLDHCTGAYITKIAKTFSEADTNIPNLDQESDWELTEESEMFTENTIEYQYVNYTKI